MGVKAAMRGQEATIASYRSPHCASKVILAGDTRQDVSRSEPLERNAPTSLSSWPSFWLFPGLPGTYLTLNGPSSDRAMLSYLAIFLSWIDGVPGKPWKSQKEVQEDQGGVKELGGPP